VQALEPLCPSDNFRYDLKLVVQESYYSCANLESGFCLISNLITDLLLVCKLQSF